MGREYELKFSADSRKIGEIQKKYGGFSTITMETVYYDTPSRDLRRRKWMLRRRMENGRPVCTLKTPLPDGSRGEWETEEAHISQSIYTLCKLGAPAELQTLTAGRLEPVCAARFTRLAAVVEVPGCTLELALDQGEFLAGDRRLPFAEVEAELKAGSEEALNHFAQALAREFDLTPQSRSKAQRAFQLADE